jgi:hypothetical protein
MIDGEVCVDFFIRFEALEAGLQAVSKRLAISQEGRRIPEFKKGFRNRRIPVRDYYDKKTEDTVRDAYQWEIERFGYQMPG